MIKLHYRYSVSTWGRAGSYFYFEVSKTFNISFHVVGLQVLMVVVDIVVAVRGVISCSCI